MADDSSDCIVIDTDPDYCVVELRVLGGRSCCSVGAMNAKGRGWPNIEMDIILASIWLALVIAGPSKKSLDAYRCKDSYNECDCSCNHTPQATPTHQKDVNINTKTTGKKVVEHEVYEA